MREKCFTFPCTCLVPRLCLGTHCSRGSASLVNVNDTRTLDDLAGRACKTVRSQAEPGNETIKLLMITVVMPSESIVNIAAYKFFRWDSLEPRRDELKSLCKQLSLRGTILISGEGINLFLAGSRESIDAFLSHIQIIPELVGLPVKESLTDYQPFNRMLVRIKREIIPVGAEGVPPVPDGSPKISPEVLKQWLDEKRPIALLDTRNDYEVELGTFENAIDLNIKNFREFPKATAAISEEVKKQPVVMFCTGGIRCEKIGPYMKGLGFQEIYQLDGGILKYFEKCQHSHYQGDCFVFDQRVAVDPLLEPSDTSECFACKRPLMPEDLESEHYVIGESCPRCYESIEEKRRNQFAKRQSAISKTAAEQRGSTPYENKRWISIPQRCAGMRLLAALHEFYPGYSQAQWQLAIDSGEILLPAASKRQFDTRPVNADDIVRDGQRFLQTIRDYTEPKINPNIVLLHEDDAIVVINKCAPLPVHPSGRFNLNTLEGILEVAYYPEKLRPAHRLDANTTGLVVLARKQVYSRFLQSQFTGGTVKKTYLAQVDGHPLWETMQCDLAISKEPIHGGSRTIDRGGQSALTRFRVLERMLDGTSLVEVVPETGRTHQIRLHLASLGFPIHNDPLYLSDGHARRQPDEEYQYQAMGLHAWRLEFIHPISRLVVRFEAPAPETLQPDKFDGPKSGIETPTSSTGWCLETLT